jgi:ERCC4-type nuclease
MTILIDTREQLPLKFTSWDWVCLKEGDYTTAKLLNHFHIERKSPQDLYGSIIQNHMRFRREILRAIDKNIKLVIYVECTNSKFIEKKWPQGDKRKVSSETLGKIIRTLQRHYDLEFVWCKNRKQMVEMVLKRFRKEERKLKR